MAEASMAEVGELLQGVFAAPDGPRRLLETLVNLAMEQEIQAHPGARRHQRTDQRIGYRNGYKPRQLGTRVGPLHLRVPQVRDAEP